jgi:hypothetical protein
MHFPEDYNHLKSSPQAKTLQKKIAPTKATISKITKRISKSDRHLLIQIPFIAFFQIGKNYCKKHLNQFFDNSI